MLNPIIIIQWVYIFHEIVIPGPDLQNVNTAVFSKMTDQICWTECALKLGQIFATDFAVKFAKNMCTVR